MPMTFQSAEDKANAEAQWRTLGLIGEAGKSIATAVVQNQKYRRQAALDQQTADLNKQKLDYYSVQKAKTMQDMQTKSNQQQASIQTGDAVADAILKNPAEYNISPEQAQTTAAMLKSGSDADRMQGINQVNDLMKQKQGAHVSSAKESLFTEYNQITQHLDQAHLSGDNKMVSTLNGQLKTKLAQIKSLGGAELVYKVASDEPYNELRNKVLYKLRTDPNNMTTEEGIIAKSTLGLFDDRPISFDALLAAQVGLKMPSGSKPEDIKKTAGDFIDGLVQKNAARNAIPKPKKPSEATSQSGQALDQETIDLINRGRKP